MSFLLEDKKKDTGKRKKKSKDESNSSNGTSSKIVSKLMPRHDNCWWDPGTKNWIAPQMQEDFVEGVIGFRGNLTGDYLDGKERKERMRLVQKKVSWVCQLSPSNRSTCRRCGEAIEKSTYRVAYPIKDRRGDYFAICNWLHLQCAAHAFYHEPDLCRHIANKSNSTMKISKDLLEKEMANYATLEEKDKKMICEQLQPRLEDNDGDEDTSKTTEPLIKPRLTTDLVNVSMLRFQEEGLYWMKAREDDTNLNGGILADEMGMGKTIQMISLIVEQKQSPTLVVCPTAAILQWRNEILRCTKDIEVRVYHGSNRNNLLNDLVKETNSCCSMEDSDEEETKNVIVLTTYQTMEFDYRQIAKLNKIECEYCGKYFLPQKLTVHLQYFCGPDAELTEKMKKTDRKNNAVQMMHIGGKETLVNLATMNRKLAMAEGRKIAEEVKKEQGVTAKKMKIGGVETEVTLKSNINKGRFPNQNVKHSTSGGLSNGMPYMPFPISALPQEAIDQIKPTQRDKRPKINSIKKEVEEQVEFKIDAYKQYNFAKLPIGGLATLKKNFINTFVNTEVNESSTKPSRKLSLKVNEITNTMSRRESSSRGSRSRRSSIKDVDMGEENKLSNNCLISTDGDMKDEVFGPKGSNKLYISLKGRKTLPPEAEMDKIIDLSQPKLNYKDLSVVNFLLQVPKYSKEDKTKAKLLSKFLLENSEFENGNSVYRDSVEEAANKQKEFLVSNSDCKKKDMIYTSLQCSLALHHLKYISKEIKSTEYRRYENEAIQDPDVGKFLNSLPTPKYEISAKTTKIKPKDKDPEFELPNALVNSKTIRADEMIHLIPHEQRNHIVEDNESKLAIHRSPLLSTFWHRVILDEAHRIKSRQTSTCQAALQLKAKKRWCVSGTPLQNRIGELFTLIRFIQFYPYSHYFCEKKGCGCCVLDWSFGLNFFCNKCNHAKSMHRNYFQKHVVLPLNKYGNNLGMGKKAMKMLQNNVLTSAVLRRTKVERAEDMHLPSLNIEVTVGEMTPSEFDFYESMYKQTKTQFDTYVDQGVLLNNYAHVFDLIMRLRQAVDHPYLIVHGMHNDADMSYGDKKDLIPSKSRKTDPKLKMCHLCQEMVTSTKELKMSNCGHGFHDDCIREYLQDAPEMPSGGIGCPTCFTSLSIDLKDLGSQEDEDDSSRSSDEDDDFENDSTDRSYAPSNTSLTNSAINKNKFMDLIDVDKFESSTKIETLLKEIKEIDENNPDHKILVFSQFIKMLDLIEFRLKQEYVSCVKLTGSLTIQQRNNIITDFTVNDEGTKVLLISTKAGGEGLNLQRANHVFVMDPWWNPAVEFQAIQRAHRIGQTRPVIAKRFIVKNTIEEKIIELQNKKQAVFEATVGKDTTSWGKLSAEDLKFLFT